MNSIRRNATQTGDRNPLNEVYYYALCVPILEAECKKSLPESFSALD